RKLVSGILDMPPRPMRSADGRARPVVKGVVADRAVDVNGRVRRQDALKIAGDESVTAEVRPVVNQVEEADEVSRLHRRAVAFDDRHGAEAVDVERRRSGGVLNV